MSISPEKILEAMVAAEREAAELVMHAHGIMAEIKTGARDVVTWCQDVRGTKGGMAMNILPEECRSYFCIEPSNFYPESEITLAQGESHTFETIITVKENAK